MDNTCDLCGKDKEDIIWFCGGDKTCTDCFEEATGYPAHPSRINDPRNRETVHQAIGKGNHE